jgi:hypothetical protein
MRLTLFQHAWKARDYDPDGAAYATEAEADAAEGNSARELLGEDFSGDDLADAIEEHTGADDVGADRLAEIRIGGRMTDAEAVMAAEELRGYDSAVYPISVEFEPAALLALVVGAQGEGGPSARALLETGVFMADTVLSRWESGDLASAVNGLEEWASDVRTAFPALDYDDADAAGDEEYSDAESEG